MVDGPPRALVELARRDLYMMGEEKAEENDDDRSDGFTFLLY